RWSRVASRRPRFRPGQKPLANVDLELVELVGVGGFGEVWKAKNPNRRHASPVALKFCLDPEAAEVLRNEVDVLDRVMSQGRHPGIVPFADTESARAFEPPDWVGREVTDDEHFRNQSLALNGLPEEPADPAAAKDLNGRHSSQSGR